MDTTYQAVQVDSPARAVQDRRVILWDMISLDGFFEGPAPGQDLQLAEFKILKSGLAILHYQPGEAQ